MATTVAQLAVAVTADTHQAEQALGSLGVMLSKTSPLVLGSLVVGAAIAGIGIIATKMAGDFEFATTRLVTGAGLAANDIGKVRTAILQMAIDTGTTTKQLTEGMFMISSAGYKTDAALKILQASAEGAKVGAADLGDVANATTTIMRDYEASNISAAQAVNLLILTEKSGKTHMEEIASSISGVLPAAAKFGVSLTDVTAALATMTAHGIPAANAVTFLRQMIVSLEAPTSAGEKALRSVGLSAQILNDDIKNKGLPETLKIITDAIGTHFPAGSAAAKEAFKEIAGGSRQMQGMLALTGTSLQMFTTDAQKMAAAVKAGGTTITDWNTIQTTFNYKLSVAKEVVEVLFIHLGQKLLPVATQLISFIVSSAIPAIQNFISFITGTSKAAEILRPLLIVVAILIAGALVAAFVAWTVAAIGAAVATIAATWWILAIGAAIALLVAALIYAYTHWGWFKTAVDGARDMMGRTIIVIGDILGWIGPKLQPAVRMTGEAFQTFGHIVDWVGGVIRALINAIQGIASAVGGAIGSLQNLGNVASGVGGAVGNALSHIPGFAAGGTMPDTGLAIVGEQGPELLRLPGGTEITPLTGGGAPIGLPSSMQRLPQSTTGSANGQPLIVHLYVDQHKLATAVAQGIPGVVRQTTGARSF